MRRSGGMFVAVGMAAAWATGAHAMVSNRIMDIATIKFILPKALPPACRDRIPKVKTEAEATSLLAECHIAFDRDHYSRLKSNTPAAEWDASLAAAPIGEVSLRMSGDIYTYFIVQKERVLSLASLNDSFPIRRVLYEGVLDGAMQKALTPIHDIDGVIAVLRAHHVSFVEDGGTLLANSVPTDVSQSLADKPGEPIVIQSKDHGVIYARRTGPEPGAAKKGDETLSNRWSFGDR